MPHILLIFIILSSINIAQAQDSASPAPLSPVQAGLDAARQFVATGERESAVAELQKIADGGFTAVAVITGDAQLATLAGYAPFDELVTDMTVKAYPCEHDPVFSEFDFWVGEWDVHGTSGALAGHNRISSEQHGCLLEENWQSASGGTGTSVNYVDKSTGEWVQIWNDSGGSQIHIRGGMTTDGMLLTGTIHYVANGSTLPFRGLWTPLPDGRVRQFFEQSNDDGVSWTPWFEGFYSRSSSGDE